MPVIERQEPKLWGEEIGAPITDEEMSARDLAIEKEVRALFTGAKLSEYRISSDPEEITRRHQEELQKLQKSERQKPQKRTLLEDNKFGNQSREYVVQKEQEDLERKRQQILAEIETWAQAITEKGDLGVLKLLVHGLMYEHNNVDLKLDIAKKIITNTADKEKRKKLNQQWQIVRKYIQEFDKEINAQQKHHFEQEVGKTTLKLDSSGKKELRQEKPSFFSLFQRKNKQQESVG